MPNISASSSSAVLTKTEKLAEEAARTTAGVLELVYSELRRLRLGDTSDELTNLLRQ